MAYIIQVCRQFEPLRYMCYWWVRRGFHQVLLVAGYERSNIVEEMCAILLHIRVSIDGTLGEGKPYSFIFFTELLIHLCLSNSCCILKLYKFYTRTVCHFVIYKFVAVMIFYLPIYPKCQHVTMD